jgi:hypothetical protein
MAAKKPAKTPAARPHSMISPLRRAGVTARDRWPAQATPANNPTPSSRQMRGTVTVTPPRFRTRNEADVKHGPRAGETLHPGTSPAGGTPA